MLTTSTLGTDRENNPESLEVDDDEEDDHSRQQIGHIRKILSVECLLQSPGFVRPCEQKVKERNDSSLELSSTATVDRGRAKRLPDDGLTAGQHPRNVLAESTAHYNKRN